MHPREVDAAIDALAVKQHGIVSRAQLLLAGVSGDAIRSRVARGWLRRLHQGVYGVGPVPGPRGREVAAVLASRIGAQAREELGGGVVCADPGGGGAREAPEDASAGTAPPEREHHARAESPAVGHHSAAIMWRLLSRRPGSAPVDVVTESYRRSRPGIRYHRTRGLQPDELTLLDGVPITTPARTILDLAASGLERGIGAALQEGMALGLVTLDAVGALVQRHPKHPGAAALRELLAHGDPVVLRSKLERRTRELLRRADVGPIQTNVKLLGYEVDTYLPDHRLVIEADGFATHSSPSAFEADRDRDGILIAAGYRVRRVTWKQVTREPEKLLVRIGMMLRPEDGPGR